MFIGKLLFFSICRRAGRAGLCRRLAARIFDFPAVPAGASAGGPVEFENRLTFGYL
jgi:hypothetical protein